MRLFLCSYRAGQHTKELIKFFGKNSKIGLISNALDYKNAKDRTDKIKELKDFYGNLGLKLEELDLRNYFNRQSKAMELVGGFNKIWIAGGNVFLLRRALQYAVIDKYLGDAVRKNEIIVGGESAGAMIFGPTLMYSEMEGDEDSPTFTPAPYKKEVFWEGLGLISYVPVPHYNSYGYADEIAKYIKRLDKAGVPYKKMTDDQAIIINGFDEEFLA